MTETRSAEDVLADLVANREEIASVTADLESKYERRTELMEEGRAVDPPVVYSRLAEATGVTQTAVIQALRKARLRRAS